MPKQQSLCILWFKQQKELWNIFRNSESILPSTIFFVKYQIIWHSDELAAIYMHYLNFSWIFGQLLLSEKIFPWFPPKKSIQITGLSRNFFHFFQDFLHQSSRTFLGLSTKFQDFPGLLRSCTNSHNKNFIFAK